MPNRNLEQTQPSTRHLSYGNRLGSEGQKKSKRHDPSCYPWARRNPKQFLQEEEKKTLFYKPFFLSFCAPSVCEGAQGKMEMAFCMCIFFPPHVEPFTGARPVFRWPSPPCSRSRVRAVAVAVYARLTWRSSCFVMQEAKDKHFPKGFSLKSAYIGDDRERVREWWKCAEKYWFRSFVRWKQNKRNPVRADCFLAIEFFEVLLPFNDLLAVMFCFLYRILCLHRATGCLSTS